MERIRAFIAVELPPATREAVEDVARRLQAEAVEGVRWVRSDGIHLTLKFLGSIGANSVPVVSEALARCAASTAPFELSLDSVGAFPGVRDPRVVWIGLGGALEPLSELQQSLERELEGLGFARERRGFTPHLTLGRTRESAPIPQRRRLAQALAATTIERREAMPVKEIALIQSDLTPTGAVYTRLYSARLGGAS